MKIPGASIFHGVITPECRVAQGGDMEAFEEAVDRGREKYRQHVEEADDELLDRQNIRVAILVETDREKD